MDKWILYILCLLFIGCLNPTRKENRMDADPFSPVLKQKIRDFIHYVDSVYPEHTKEMFYTFNVKKVGDTNYVVLRTEYYYNPEIYRIGGYTFLDSNLVVFENGPGPIYLENFESLDIQFLTPVILIDTTQLIKFKDSIPGCQDGRKGIGEYEPYMYKYRLIGEDSLILVFAGRW